MEKNERTQNGHLIGCLVGCLFGSRAGLRHVKHIIYVFTLIDTRAMSQQTPEKQINNSTNQSVDVGNSSCADNIISAGAIRKNPKRECCTESKPIACASESENIKIKSGVRRRRSRLNEQINLVKGVIPSSFMTEHASEYTDKLPKNFERYGKQIVRPAVLYTAVRYIEHLKNRVEQLENGKSKKLY